jgi:hypothetical protein
MRRLYYLSDIDVREIMEANGFDGEHISTLLHIVHHEYILESDKKWSKDVISRLVASGLIEWFSYRKEVNDQPRSAYRVAKGDDRFLDVIIAKAINDWVHNNGGLRLML